MRDDGQAAYLRRARVFSRILVLDFRPDCGRFCGSETSSEMLTGSMHVGEPCSRQISQRSAVTFAVTPSLE